MPRLFDERRGDKFNEKRVINFDTMEEGDKFWCHIYLMKEGDKIAMTFQEVNFDDRFIQLKSWINFDEWITFWNIDTNVKRIPLRKWSITKILYQCQSYQKLKRKATIIKYVGGCWS